MFYFNFEKYISNGQMNKKKKKKVYKTKIAKDFQVQQVKQIKQILFFITNLEENSIVSIFIPEKNNMQLIFALSAILIKNSFIFLLGFQI